MDSFRHSVQGHPLLVNRDWLLSTQTPSLVHSAAAGAAGPAQSRGMPFQEAPREGSSSAEGGLGLVDMIDMSRTETRKQRQEKMVVAFCAVGSSPHGRHAFQRVR